jgi:hypothetical protein
MGTSLAVARAGQNRELVGAFVADLGAVGVLLALDTHDVSCGAGGAGDEAPIAFPADFMLAAKAVQDADRLHALGAVGLAQLADEIGSIYQA